MKTDPHVTSARAETDSSSNTSAVLDVEAVGVELPREVPARPAPLARAVAEAHGRLDVMGGIAEYTGGLVLHFPTAARVTCTVEPSSSGNVSVKLLPSSEAAQGQTVVALRDLPAGGDADRLAAVRAAIGADTPEAVLCAIGVIAELSESGVLGSLRSGLTLTITQDGQTTSCANHGAVAGAVIAAVCAMQRVPVEIGRDAALAQRVENRWLGVPSGPADAAAALASTAGHLQQIHCASPCTLGPPVPLPDGVEFVGVDCGVIHPGACEKYRQVRIAGFMGIKLISLILQHEGSSGAWNGLLSRFSINDFVERFRDRLPTKLSGRVFIDRFGALDDPLTTTDPDFVYKIRSRTEHHIYENSRSHTFVECMLRAQRTRDIGALRQAGELMYASHWSYGQRCGLGSVETDALVSGIRRHGESVGILGAKISGRGCGGVVVVLMQSTAAARAALSAAMSEYEDRFQRTPRVIEGSSANSLAAA